MEVGARRRACAVAAVVIACVLGAPARAAAAPATPAQVPHLPGAPVCGPSAADPHQPADGNPQATAGPDYFASDLPRFTDSAFGLPVGGFGGVVKGATLHHTPVVFVHGNQADAQNWLDVMLQFQNDAHYTMQEMYALSYGGLANYAAGSPVQNAPTSLDQAYISQNPATLYNDGHGYADDDEVPQLCRFVELVQWYTGSRQVDIVTHSLGDTIGRRFMQLYPLLARDVVAFVGIAGANHGTTVCRGLETSYYGCNEIAPGTPWLAQLNARDESPAPTRWMTIYNGSDSLDPFFSDPSDYPSPALAGADNRTFALQYHNDLRVGTKEVDTYLPFLLRHGQAGPGASTTGAADAAAIESAQPNGMTGPIPTLCGVPKLTGGDPAGCPPPPAPPAAASSPGGSHSGSAPSTPSPAAAGSAATLPDTMPTVPSGVAAMAALTALAAAAVTARPRRRRSRSSP